MGVNAIVITENARGLSLRSFSTQLEADLWGRRATQRLNGLLAWEPFTWEHKRYLSWLAGPRWRHLGLDRGIGSDGPIRPDATDSIQVMLAIEQICGGNLYVGPDVIGCRLPRDAVDGDDGFRLPPRLDDWIDDWRSAGEIEPEEPGLVF
jgi:hypothetical protein